MGTVHFSIDDTAGNSIDGDSAGRKFSGKRFCECIHTALGGGIGNLTGRADISPYG